MEINPFENVIVSEPRLIETPVPGLNEKPLQALHHQFNSLIKDDFPRTVKLSGAQFLLSPEPGYGKSHLIGRLFKLLKGKSTLVYLRPFTSADSCWKSILLKLVQELEFPESASAKFNRADEASQLAALAHGILMKVALFGCEAGDITLKPENKAQEFFKKSTIKKLRQDEAWKKWLADNKKKLAAILNKQLDTAGIRLNASTTSWVSVFIQYAYFPSQFDLNQACIDWLKGGSIDDEEAKEIGIRPADCLGFDLSIELVNEFCKDRIVDFCGLAGLYRPFIFCFDQTEYFASNPELAKQFGIVIQQLVDDACNHATVITANQHPWVKGIEPNLEQAYMARISKPTIELEGIDKDQSKALIEQRMKAFDLSDGEIERFMDLPWLDESFKNSPEMGIRRFLNACSSRWNKIHDSDEDIDDNFENAIEKYYQKYVNAVKSDPKRFVFNPDVLYWLIKEVVALPGLKVGEVSSVKSYFNIVWQVDGGRIYFGFEGGAHWRRWQAITREASRYSRAHKKSKALFFKTPDLISIPRSNWQIAGEMYQARKKFMHFLQLTPSDMAHLYAAYDLHIAASQGDIPFSSQACLKFIQQKLKSFWELILEFTPSKWRQEEIKIKQPPKRPPDSDSTLIKKVRAIVKKEKFLSVEELIKKLPGSVSEDDIHQAHSEIPEIKALSTPKMTVLQWQPNT